jgi:hypothetical protein
MGRQAVKYWAALLALGILVKHASGTGTVFSQGASGIAKISNSLNS